MVGMGLDDWAEWNGDRDAKQQQARESKQQGERAGESRQKSRGQASQATATAAPAATGNDGGGGGGGDSGQPQALATAAEPRPSFALPFQSPASSCSSSASPSQLFWAAAFLSHFAFVCFAPSAGSSMLRRPALPTSAPKLRIPSWLFRSVAGGRLRRGRLGDSSLIGPMASEMDASSFDELAAEAPERPPSLEQLKQLTGGRFTQRWLKYMYNRFKNECPSGRMRFAEFKRLFGGFIPDRINDVYLERMFHAFCQNSANLEQLTFRDLVICLSRLCDERPASNAEWTMRLIGRDRSGQISPQEFHEYCKSVFLLRGKGEQNEQKKRAGSLLLGGGGSPISGRLEQQTHQPPQQQQQPQLSRPPTIRSAALLASAITTPTAAPAIANFVPFVGSQQKRGPASPEQELARAIRRRSSILFKELDADQKGYLTTSDFERFFRTWDQKPLIYTAG